MNFFPPRSRRGRIAAIDKRASQYLPVRELLDYNCIWMQHGTEELPCYRDRRIRPAFSTRSDEKPELHVKCTQTANNGLADLILLSI